MFMYSKMSSQLRERDEVHEVEVSDVDGLFGHLVGLYDRSCALDVHPVYLDVLRVAGVNVVVRTRWVVLVCCEADNVLRISVFV